MPNPNTNFKTSDGVDLGNKLITKEYLMTVYPQIAANMITPELWVWGNNSNAALGTNDTANRITPVTTLAGGANWKQVACGYAFNAAIKTDGTLWVWGYNSYNGQGGYLGTNDTVNRLTPVTTFAGGTNWKQVACGTIHTAAIKTDGTLWIWGYGNDGSLGTNNAISRSTPVTTFAGGTNWKQVACGQGHTAAIKTDGTLWVWGTAGYGMLGTNDTIQRSIPVTTFAGGNNWKQVSCGRLQTAAIKTDGTLWIWGRNDGAQLGLNTVGGEKSTPVTTFAGGTNWKQVDCGYYQTAAIKTDGTLWIWGLNADGALGINIPQSGPVPRRSTPVTTFAGGTNWKQVSCAKAFGLGSTAAIKTDGTLWTWGDTTGVGDNQTRNRSTPVTTFAGGNNWKQVACGFDTIFGAYVAAIKTSDDLIGI